MSVDDYHAEKIDAQVRQIRLCALVVESVLDDFANPVTPDSKADLLLAAEALALDVVRLVDQSRALAWNQPSAEIHPDTLM